MRESDALPVAVRQQLDRRNRRRWRPAGVSSQKWLSPIAPSLRDARVRQSLSLSLTSTRGVSKEFPPPLSLSFFLLATTTHLPSKPASLWLDYNTMSKGLSRSACCAPLSVFLLHPFASQGRGQPRRDANSSLFFFFSSANASPLSLHLSRIRDSLLARACTLLLFFFLSLFLLSVSLVRERKRGVYRAGNQLEIRR